MNRSQQVAILNKSSQYFDWIIDLMNRKHFKIPKNESNKMVDPPQSYLFTYTDMSKHIESTTLRHCVTMRIDAANSKDAWFETPITRFSSP